MKKKTCWLRATRNPTVGQLSTLQKSGFQMAKETSKKITGKNKSSIEIKYPKKNSSFVCKILPKSKIFLWGRAPQTHSSIRTSPDPGAIKGAISAEPLWPPWYWLLHKDPYNAMVDNPYISLVFVYKLCLFCSIEVHGWCHLVVIFWCLFWHFLAARMLMSMWVYVCNAHILSNLHIVIISLASAMHVLVNHRPWWTWC